MVYVPVPPGPGVVKTSNIDLCSVPCRHPPHHLMSANLRLRPRFNGLCPSGVPMHMCPLILPYMSQMNLYRTILTFHSRLHRSLVVVTFAQEHANQDLAKATAFLKRPHRMRTMLSDGLFLLNCSAEGHGAALVTLLQTQFSPI